VVLDPSVCVQYGTSSCNSGSAADGWISSAGPDLGPGNTYIGDYNRIGTDHDYDGIDYGTMRSLLWFQYVGVPDGAAITSADLHLYEQWYWGLTVPQINARHRLQSNTTTATLLRQWGHSTRDLPESK